MDKRISEAVDTVNKYFSEYEVGFSINAEKLMSSSRELDRATDAVIALICKIGVDENFAPNIHGVILDGCLETLNEIRGKYFAYG